MSMSIPLRAVCLSSLMLVAVSGGAYAQHAHSHAAPNGGQVQKIGKFEAELAVKGAQATLYVTDENDKKVDAGSMAATAVVLAKGNQQKTVEMKPAGDNKLASAIDFPVEGKFRATVTLRDGTAEVGKARYSLDAK